jgi:hypothetical protein
MCFAKTNAHHRGLWDERGKQLLLTNALPLAADRLLILDDRARSS